MQGRERGDDVVRLAHGCWIAAAERDDFAARCAAALAVSGPDTVLSSTTAALVYPLWLPSWVTEEIHLASAQAGRAARSMNRNRRAQFHAHRHQLLPQDVTVVNGLPLMSLPRLWLDLATRLPFADLVAAGDSALRLGATVEAIDAVLHRSSGMRGVGRARIALPLLDAHSRSRPESHLRIAASARDLPRWEVNQPAFRADGGWLGEPDLALPDAKIALEYQGSDHATLVRMRKDITRGVDFRREGWLCLVYGPAEVFGRPWQIQPEVRALISRRAPHLLRAG